jgi:hypothetical protein
MRVVILFGIGSPIVIDYEETLYRTGGSIVAGIQNRDGTTHTSDGIAVEA